MGERRNKAMRTETKGKGGGPKKSQGTPWLEKVEKGKKSQNGGRSVNAGRADSGKGG